MKLLFFEWNAFMQNDVERILKNIPEIEADYVSYEFKDCDHDDLFLERFPTELLKKKYDAVFSLNFFPLVSDVCEKYNIPYISWVYDAPMNVRKVESFANPVNQIYVFDRGQYKDLRAKGYTTVFHKPLGVDTSRAFPVDDDPRFNPDISFVGKLYDSEFPYITERLPNLMAKELDDLVNEQLSLYGNYILANFLSDEYMEKYNAYYQGSVSREALEFVLACETTHRERILALNELAKKYPVTIYSYSKCDALFGVKNNGAVNYYTEMPKVFHNSKINLNITLKIIKEGMPLRVLDILGCGGFLLSNYQPELNEYFTDGKEIATYRSINELCDVAGYYLAHPDKRLEVAHNGYLRAKELFDLEKMLREILL